MHIACSAVAHAHAKKTPVTDLWITNLLFDLSYKFINGRFAFSPG